MRVEKEPWWYDVAMLEFGPVLGSIWIFVGSFVVTSALITSDHLAIYVFGGLFFVIAGLALQFTKRTEDDDREFFGGR